jgi:hypothetical protein
MKEIPLTQGKVAIVDDDDFEWLSQWKWYCCQGYAVRNSPTDPNGKRGTIRMHREINHTPTGMETDHLNGNRLDDRKSNLRTCTTQENRQNFGIKRNNTSGYKGVSKDGKFRGTGKQWRARIRINKKETVIGFFSDPVEAAHAWDDAARKYYGNCIRTNFPIERR